MKKLFSFVCLVAFIASIDAHGRLSSPPSRGILAGTKTQAQELAPVSSGAGTDFICRDDPAPDASKYQTIQAGAPFTIQWEFTAAHPGDCFLYITYDVNIPDAQKLWFKIASIADCRAQNNQPITVNIPNYLAGCAHCIIRWEWYGLHLYPVGPVEFYAQCFDAVVVAAPGFSNPALGTPRYNIPGHLPLGPITQFYRNPFDLASSQFITGPALATYDPTSVSLIGAPAPAPGTPGAPGSPGSSSTSGPGSVNVAAAVIIPLVFAIVIFAVVAFFVVRKFRPYHYDQYKGKVVGAVDSVKSRFS